MQMFPIGLPSLPKSAYMPSLGIFASQPDPVGSSIPRIQSPPVGQSSQVAQQSPLVGQQAASSDSGAPPITEYSNTYNYPSVGGSTYNTTVSQSAPPQAAPTSTPPTTGTGTTSINGSQQVSNGSNTYTPVNPYSQGTGVAGGLNSSNAGWANWGAAGGLNTGGKYGYGQI